MNEKDETFFFFHNWECAQVLAKQRSILVD